MMRTFTRVIEKIWNRLLDAIAWATQDNACFRKARDRPDVKNEIIMERWGNKYKFW
jgi:hypothetical protein